MSIDMLLRALRKCSILANKWHGYGGTLFDLRMTQKGDKYERIANKIHKKIVERFERIIKAGRELYLDKFVREEEIAKFDNTTVRCCNRNWFASVGSQFKCPLCGEEKLLLGIVK
jgi:hypothetical protein